MPIREDYIIGQIYGVLDTAKPLPLTVKTQAPINGGAYLAKTIQRSQLSEKLDARMQDLFGQLETFPEGPRDASQQGEFWLGFYHEKKRLADG